MDVPRHVREFSHRIVESGAVMAVSGSPAVYTLVGALRWTEDGRLMWFIAHGDSEADAHVIDFDHAQLVDTLGICFFKGERLIGYLSPIAHAQVEDPDDYRIGFQIWKEVAPLYETMIERAFDQLEFAPDSGLRPPGYERTYRATTVAA